MEPKLPRLPGIDVVPARDVPISVSTRNAGMLGIYIQQAKEKLLTIIVQRITHQCAYCVSYNGNKMSWGLISCESFQMLNLVSTDIESMVSRRQIWGISRTDAKRPIQHTQQKIYDVKDNMEEKNW